MAKKESVHEYECLSSVQMRHIATQEYSSTEAAQKPSDTELRSEVVLTKRELAAALERAEGERARIEVDQRLRVANEQLDVIQERTSELASANERLQREIERRVRTEEMLRKLSERILTLQDEERRRLGRELHDSVGQMLAALHINLGVIARKVCSDPALAAKVADTAALTDQVISEIRTLSYLLHPPMLDEAGLASAVDWYVRGFSERSKISVRLEVDPSLPRFPTEVETAIFRIIQESLVNIHRHSGSRTASITLRSSSAGAALTIRDEGRGIPPEVLKSIEGGAANFGVGIGGMRERARQLRGSIDIRRADPGTLVEVNFPVLKSAASTVLLSREAAV